MKEQKAVNSPVHEQTRYEKWDMDAWHLKSEAKFFGGIVIIACFAYSFFSPLYMGASDSSLGAWQPHPWIVFPSVLVAAVALFTVYRLCKFVDKKTAEHKATYREQLEHVVSVIEGLEIDDSGSQPVLKQRNTVEG